jgi:hypothetical protein
MQHLIRGAIDDRHRIVRLVAHVYAISFFVNGEIHRVIPNRDVRDHMLGEGRRQATS